MEVLFADWLSVAKWSGESFESNQQTLEKLSSVDPFLYYVLLSR